MNVAAASPPPASPVADGSATLAGQVGGGQAGAGQTGEAATGFDAMLAVVAGLAAPTEPEAAAEPAAAPAADAEAAPADAMLAMLAAMMAPAAPAPLAHTTTAAVADTAAQTAALPAVGLQPSTSTPAFDAPPLAEAAPVIDPSAMDAAPALAAPGAPAAPDIKTPPALERAAKAPPAPAALASAAPPVAVAAAAAPLATAAPTPAPTGKTDAPARSAAAPNAQGQPAAKPGPAAAPVEAVKTETAEAVSAVGTTGGQGAAPDAGLGADLAAAAAPVAAEAPTPTVTNSAPPAATDPVRLAQAAAPLVEPPVVRGSPETVAKLSADILKKLDGRSTRFELTLDPAGLGRVGVKVEIGAHGQITAALSFDNPQAAAELRGRAGELRHTLQQAGFDLPENALSFDLGNPAGGDGRDARAAWNEPDRGQGRGAAFAGRAFEAVLNGAETLASDLSLRFGAPRADGVDVRI